MSDDSCDERSSDLGKLEFWEEVYARDINNFKDHGDVGEIWFGNKASLKVVRWISQRPEVDKENDKIIDIGCGNAVILTQLAKEGFKKLTGVDYSQKAIDLAAEIIKNKNIDCIDVAVCDILNPELPNDFKIVHDKGTYDAISLYSDEPIVKRRVYVEKVHKLLLPNGYLILTSCNWTRRELEEHFGSHFDVVEQLPMDTFQFGGQSGSTVTQLVMKKKEITR